MKSGFYRKDPKLLLLSRVTLVSFIVQLSFLKMLNCQYRYGSKHLLIRHLAFFILVQTPSRWGIGSQLHKLKLVKW